MSSDAGFQDTLELVERARSGDQRALRALVVRYREPLLARIRLMLGAPARREAESSDFLQDVFLELVRGIEGFRPTDERALMRWMTAIARNSIRAAGARRREAALEHLSGILTGSAEIRTPSNDASRREHALIVVESLEELGEEHRAVIELRILDGLSWAEVGRRLERSAEAARKLYHRGIMRLGEVLERRMG